MPRRHHRPRGTTNPVRLRERKRSVRRPPALAGQGVPGRRQRVRLRSGRNRRHPTLHQTGCRTNPRRVCPRNRHPYPSIHPNAEVDWPFTLSSQRELGQNGTTGSQNGFSPSLRQTQTMASWKSFCNRNLRISIGAAVKRRRLCSTGLVWRKFFTRIRFQKSAGLTSKSANGNHFFSFGSLDSSPIQGPPHLPGEAIHPCTDRRKITGIVHDKPANHFPLALRALRNRATHTIFLPAQSLWPGSKLDATDISNGPLITLDHEIPNSLGAIRVSFQTSRDQRASADCHLHSPGNCGIRFPPGFQAKSGHERR